MADFTSYPESGYTVQTEPDYKRRSYNWKTAIGLQQVDGLTPSPYLIETANANIEGKISIDEAGLLFDGVLDCAGIIRDCNISKREWVLNGESVVYDDFRTIRDSLDYDIGREREFDYSKLGQRQTVEHIAKFISGLWQIHAFSEGNTRTVAVFAIKYLRTFGYDVTNDTFEKHSWYFRNSLVRANYNNHSSNIRATPLFLNMFFDNLLLGGEHKLLNRELHVTGD
jgi:fido (protein-threonine AMPylation protein)